MDWDRANNAGNARDQAPHLANLPNLTARTAKTVSPIAIDFCCGLGGLSLAARQIGMTIVAGVDTDSDSLKTYSRNFPEAIAIEETVSGSKVVEHCRNAIDCCPRPKAPLIVLSGPPCQGFSAAGSRDPGDKRNKTLLGVARVIKTLRPTCALVENVCELLTDKHSRRMKNFEKHLFGAGYHVLSIELDAKDYGVPQKRRRAFFLITRKRLNKETVIRKITQLRKPEVSCAAFLDDLPPAEVRGSIYCDDEELRSANPNHLAMRHSQVVKKKIAAIAVGRGPMSYRKLDPSKPANTLFSGHRAPPAHYKYPRSITVREAARLQGFPDDFRIYGAFANQMMQVTNAVPPPLARVVLQVLTELTGIGRNRNG